MCLAGLTVVVARAPETAKGDATACRVAGGDRLCSSELCDAPSEEELATDLWPPRPFQPETLKVVYEFPEHDILQQYLHARRAYLNTQMQKLTSGEKLALDRLRRDGLEWNELGLDLSRLAHVRHADNVSKVLQDDDVQFAVKLLLQAVNSADVQAYDRGGQFAMAMFVHDQPLKVQACTLSPETGGLKKAVRRFLANGWVQFKDISSMGVDIKQLADQAAQGLRAEGFLSKYGSWTSNTILPALEPLLHNPKFAKLIHGYLGQNARFDGYFTFALPQGLTTTNYTAGHWHHDRCGRRIRMAIFLHDIDDDGRPTLVASGSHNLAFYNHIGALEMSRFTDEYVRSRYRVKRFTGKAGGFFLLDTNALHKGDLSGSRDRTVIFLEFHARGKLPALLQDDRGKMLPCPSLKSNGHAALSYDWRLGRPGYPHFPTDEPFPETVQYRSEL